jgi:hypothetical protein
MKVGCSARQERRTIEKNRRVEDTAGEIMSNHPRDQCAGSVSVPIISAVANSGEFAGPSIFAAFPAFGVFFTVRCKCCGCFIFAHPLYLYIKQEETDMSDATGVNNVSAARSMPRRRRPARPWKS